MTSSAQRKMGKWDKGMMCTEHRFYHHLWIPYIVRSKIMYVLPGDKMFCAQSSVILVFIPLVASQAREINTKITLPLALKQFLTRVHTLFSIHHVRSLSIYILLLLVHWLQGHSWFQTLFLVRILHSSPPRQNGCHFRSRHFQMHFYERKISYFHSNFIEVCY